MQFHASFINNKALTGYFERDKKILPEHEKKDSVKMGIRDIIDELAAEGSITRRQVTRLLKECGAKDREYLASKAREVREKWYGKNVYIRGLIEFTSYCRNDCYYCGLRCSNEKAERYRLSERDTLGCCREGYALGFRTFVLQGGEDPFFGRDALSRLISSIKKNHPDCAVTLSFGEHPKEAYKEWFDAGADRYLLRHETANEIHYRFLHPEWQKLQDRKKCLWNLKEIGYQVGSGFMVGSPGQNINSLIDDLEFLEGLQPEMVGIGPFIPHRDTPFAGEDHGRSELTLMLLSIIRLMFPRVLLPATTALATISEDGRERGLLAGANVVMPNLSPVSVRGKYSLYDNKICTGEEAAEALSSLKKRLKGIGFNVVVARGDFKRN